MGKDLRLAGERVLITGASGALGGAFALRLAEEGADLALHYNANAAMAEDLATKIRADGREVVTIHTDLSNHSSGDLDHPCYLYHSTVN